MSLRRSVLMLPTSPFSLVFPLMMSCLSSAPAIGNFPANFPATCACVRLRRSS